MSLVLIPQHFGCLLFDRHTSRYLPFDHPCTGLLRRIAAVGVEDVAPEADDFCSFLFDQGHLRLDGRLDAEILELTPPADRLAGPLAVHLEVVAACNLTCKHCFAGALPRRERPLSLDELDALFLQLARMGCYRLGLTGGEPLLRKDLLDILDAAVARGLHPCLTTNALLLDERMARELGRRPLVWLNVSLEGATAEVNDPVRGEGTFARVLDQARLLARHARFTMAFTLTGANAHQASECARLARELGAMAAVFRPLYPVGVARQHLELMPTFGEYTQALESLQGDIHALDPFSPQTRASTRSRIYTGSGCAAANLVCSVSVGGDVNPCSFLGPEFAAGNLRDRSFPEIWHESPVFRQLRETPEEAFQGGCRARAQTLAGSVHARDPWEQEAWQLGLAHPARNLERQA